MGELNSAMTGLMDSIRAKSGVTGKLGVVAAKQAVDSIQTGGDAADLPYRRYTGTIAETVVGSGKYAVLAKSSELAAHRTDAKLFVRVEFDIAATAYTVVKNWTLNDSLNSIWDSTGVYQQIFRWDGNAGKSIGRNENPPTAGFQSSVGFVEITEDGELRCYSNSSNYAIRPCNYTAEVMWG